MDAEDKMVKY